MVLSSVFWIIYLCIYISIERENWVKERKRDKQREKERKRERKRNRERKIWENKERYHFWFRNSHSTEWRYSKFLCGYHHFSRRILRSRSNEQFPLSEVCNIWFSIFTLWWEQSMNLWKYPVEGARRFSQHETDIIQWL